MQVVQILRVACLPEGLNRLRKAQIAWYKVAAAAAT